MLRNPWARLLNNWAHDVGSGLWAACVFVIWMLRGRMYELATTAGPAFATAMLGVMWSIFWVLVGALVVIAFTGVIRLLYWRRETPPELMPAKRPALVGKHVAFLVIYGGGSVWAYFMLLPR